MYHSEMYRLPDGSAPCPFFQKASSESGAHRLPADTPAVQIPRSYLCRGDPAFSARPPIRRKADFPKRAAALSHADKPPCSAHPASEYRAPSDQKYHSSGSVSAVSGSDHSCPSEMGSAPYASFPQKSRGQEARFSYSSCGFHTQALLP